MRRVKSASVLLRKHICRAFLTATTIALTAATALTAFAQDDDRPRWFGGTYDKTAILAYGVPDSDYVILSFSCRPGAPAVKVDIQDEESGASEGDLLQVRLATAGAHVAFSRKAVGNQDSGGVELHAELPLDETLRRILTSDEPLEVTVGKHTQRYAKDATVELAATRLFAACESPKPANDLDVTVTNKARLPLQSFAYSQAGVDSFESDAFGYEPLDPGASRTFTIPGGRDICTFDIAVNFVEDEKECCSMAKPAGTQNLCETGAFVVHD